MRLLVRRFFDTKMMSGCLYCFAKNGGLLLHCRTYNGFKPLPLPVIASLNGAHDYLLDSQTELLSFATKDFSCTWREYHDVLKFVVVMNGSLPDGENRDVPVLLDFLWMVLVGHTGERALLECADVDLLKRYVSQSAKTLDSVMTEFLASSDLALGIFLGASLFAYPSNAATLKSLVEIFCGEFSLTHCSIIADDRLTILSTGLSSLNPIDLLLLVFAVSLNPDPGIVSEQLLFFPHFSPNQAYRIIVMKLASNIFLTFFAGADFVFDGAVQAKMESYWRNEVDAIKRVMDLAPKWLPVAVEQQLPPSLMGMILWNTETKRFFASPIFLAATEEKISERRRTMVTFYRMVSHMLRKSSEGRGPPIRDVYRSFDERKFYFIQRDKYQLFAMFDAGEPQHSLRHVTEIVLALCTKRHAAQPL